MATKNNAGGLPLTKLMDQFPEQNKTGENELTACLTTRESERTRGISKTFLVECLQLLRMS